MSVPLGIYTRYDRLGASSRYRYYLYEDALREAGFTPQFHPFFSDRYLRDLYAGKGKSRLLGAGSLLRRFREVLHLPERLLIEYELLPEIPWDIESRLLRSRKYVLNFDDNVWEKYRTRPSLAGKYDALIANARGVVAANDFLFEKISKINASVIKIPTAVDLAGYPAGAVEKFPRFTVGWIGTPVTYRYLELHADALRAMSRTVDFELLVIARASLPPLDGVAMRCVDWSAATEAELLCRCHAGIMPLPADDPFAAGKSAFKLIQYLAAGIPAIASPVGENNSVIRPGKTGFPASTPGEWSDALLRLSDENIRRAMAENARALAFDYSIQKYAPIYTGFLKDALNG